MSHIYHPFWGFLGYGDIWGTLWKASITSIIKHPYPRCTAWCTQVDSHLPGIEGTVTGWSGSVPALDFGWSMTEKTKNKKRRKVDFITICSGISMFNMQCSFCFLLFFTVFFYGLDNGKEPWWHIFLAQVDALVVLPSSVFFHLPGKWDRLWYASPFWGRHRSHQ